MKPKPKPEPEGAAAPGPAARAVVKVERAILPADNPADAHAAVIGYDAGGKFVAGFVVRTKDVLKYARGYVTADERRRIAAAAAELDRPTH